MISFFLLTSLAAIVSGSLCGALGFHVQRFNAVTLSFTVAHAALAGAALGLIAGIDVTYTAMILALSSAALLGAFFTKIIHERELISMALFSLFSALALLAIYMSNVTVLATSSVAVVLWGSLLAVTLHKLIMLACAAALFILYTSAYRMHIDAILYDSKLAEAEGVDVQAHTFILLFFVGAAIALTLKLMGGFLVFALLYNPVVAASQITKNARRQLHLSALLGASSALLGLTISYVLNWPVGAAIALTSSIILLASFIYKLLATRAKKPS